MIKTPVLLSRHIVATTLAVLIGAIAALPDAARAGNDKAFCVDYADEAVRLQKRNIADGCGITGLRWHEWWDGHYGWCKDWVSADTVDDEQELRRIQLDKCAGGDERRSRRSERY